MTPAFLPAGFALLTVCHLPSPSSVIEMETRYLTALVGTLHIVCLWMVTRSMATAPNDTLGTKVPWYIEIAKQFPSAPLSCDGCRHSVFHHIYLSVVTVHIGLDLSII